MISTLVIAAEVGAQRDHSTAFRVLSSSRDFRARVRAALALGSSGDQSVTGPLIAALNDESPAVRAAAATALGRLGSPNALAPLRARISDGERSVRREAQRAVRRIEAAHPNAGAPRRSGARERLPRIAIVPRSRDISWPQIHYVVVVGAMENRSAFTDESLGPALARAVDRSLVLLRGVAVLHEGHEPASAAREIRRRRLPQLRLEGSVSRVDRETARGQLSVRSEVSLMLMDNGRNIRAELNGAATARGPRARQRAQRAQQEQRLAQQALTGAVQSAMRGAARAISNAGHR